MLIDRKGGGAIGGGSRARNVPREDALGQACDRRGALAKWNQDKKVIRV